MMKLMLRSALCLAALTVGYSGELTAWQPTGASYYESSAQITQAASFPWMSEQVTSSNNRWVLPESSVRSFAGGTGVNTADAMFSSYWVGETPVSSYVNNTPFPTTSLTSSGSSLAVFGGTSSYSGTYSPTSSLSTVSSSVPSNIVASTYNFGSSSSSLTSYGGYSGGSSSGSSGGLLIFGGGENLYAGPTYLSSQPIRFDADPIPEPQTYMMIGGGLLALAMMRRRSTKR